MAATDHNWDFHTTVYGDDKRNPLLVAVCRKCGFIRSALVRVRGEAKIDLEGECPQEPEERRAPNISGIG